MERQNLRWLRVRGLTAEIMKAIDPFIDPRGETQPSRIARAIEELLSDKGIEILTDFDRSEMGLPPRGPDGWTVEEIIAADRRYLEALLKPMQHTIVAPGIDRKVVP